MGGIVPAISRSQRVDDGIRGITTFFRDNVKVLSSQHCKKEDPHLVMLRMILGCDYGRPKLIQYLLRTTPILYFVSGENNWFKEDLEDSSFIVEDFISKFAISNSSVDSESGARGYETLSVSELKSSSPFLILITVVASYQSFLKTQEHSDWLKYQQMMSSTRYSNSANFARTPVSSFSCSQIEAEIQSVDYREFFHQSFWIVALASLLDKIPFPVSILGQTISTDTPNSNNLATPLASPSDSHDSVATSALMIFFANNAFVEMVGETREEMAYPFDKYLRPQEYSTSSSDDLPPSIDFKSLSRIGVQFYPHPPLKPFMDLQSRIPLRDLQGECHYVLVMHCDIRRFRHSEYLQTLGRLTDILSQAVIPQREHSHTFLRAYFYRHELKQG
jgi:hypothetical protein